MAVYSPGKFSALLSEGASSCDMPTFSSDFMAESLRELGIMSPTSLFVQNFVDMRKSGEYSPKKSERGS